MPAVQTTRRHLLVTKPGKRAKVAKTAQKHALLTLRAVATLGVATVEQVFAANSTRTSLTNTRMDLWTMFDMGLVDAADSESTPGYTNNAPLRYTLSDLGRAVLAWT
jgi:hypothetical protein